LSAAGARNSASILKVTSSPSVADIAGLARRELDHHPPRESHPVAGLEELRLNRRRICDAKER
jgi:hypothetical protein